MHLHIYNYYIGHGCTHITHTIQTLTGQERGEEKRGETADLWEVQKLRNDTFLEAMKRPNILVLASDGILILLRVRKDIIYIRTGGRCVVPALGESIPCICIKTTQLWGISNLLNCCANAGLHLVNASAVACTTRVLITP